jgi:ectoine hydroxylase-related dioxygenase (phytanoyl-CoA dioxygenase family)
MAWQLAKNLPLEKILAVQYFVLKPGGLIIPHTDTIDRGLTRFHFCITQPQTAHTYFENYGTVPYEKGSCFIFDPSVKHAAINDSSEPRFYLQVSGVFGSRINEMYQLLENSLQQYYKVK